MGIEPVGLQMAGADTYARWKKRDASSERTKVGARLTDGERWAHHRPSGRCGIRRRANTICDGLGGGGGPITPGEVSAGKRFKRPPAAPGEDEIGEIGNKTAKLEPINSLVTSSRHGVLRKKCLHCNDWNRNLGMGLLKQGARDARGLARREFKCQIEQIPSRKDHSVGGGDRAEN